MAVAEVLVRIIVAAAVAITAAVTGTGVSHRQIARSLFGIKLDMFLRHILTKILM